MYLLVIELWAMKFDTPESVPNGCVRHIRGLKVQTPIRLSHATFGAGISPNLVRPHSSPQKHFERMGKP